MKEKNFETPQSDFDRWQDREDDMDENLKKGKEVYIKGEKKNG
jgi:cytochrome c peroxidase